MSEGRRSRAGSAAGTPVSTPSRGGRADSSIRNRRNKSRSPDDSDDGGAKDLGQEMQGAGDESQESQGGRDVGGRPFATVLTQETIETQRHIQCLMWYLIAVAGVDVNLGRQTSTECLETQILHEYRKLVGPFAEAYFAYMTHEHGGKKEHACLSCEDTAPSASLARCHRDIQCPSHTLLTPSSVLWRVCWASTTSVCRSLRTAYIRRSRRTPSG